MRNKIQAFWNIRKAKSGLVVAKVSNLLASGFEIDYLAKEFVRINQEVWGTLTKEEYLWTEKRVKKHFNTCPHIIYCAFSNGKMMATLTNIFTTEDLLHRNKSWLEKTGDGYLTTHRPEGDVGFGVDLTVTREAPKKLSDKLVLAAIFDGVIGQGLKAVYLGARIPGYRKNMDMKVEDYVFGKRANGKPLDPELYFYMKDGFEIVEVIPEYMDDPDSLNYGVLIKWSNPLYRTTKALPFLKPLIRFIGKLLFLGSPQRREA